jgi:hypothetical protein
MSVIVNGKKFEAKFNNGKLNLDLSNKQIEDIRHIFGLEKIRDLHELILDDNRIREIKGLENLTKLEKLSLKKNKITEIDGLENLENLTELDLSRNKISTLKGLHNQNKLQTLNLYGNPVDFWIKEELTPSIISAKVAVGYCQKGINSFSFDMDEINTFLAENFNEAIEFAHKKDYYNLMRVLRKVSDKVILIKEELFFQFLGNILENITDLFNIKFNEAYNEMIYLFLPAKRIFLMESYLLKNFCFYQDEQLITYFTGKVTFRDIIIKGRIYLTNYRVIAIGTIHGKVLDYEDIWFKGLLLSEIIGDIHKKFQTKVLKSISESQDAPWFGFQFPFGYIQHYWYDDRSLTFTSEMLLNKKKQKPITIKISSDERYDHNKLQNEGKLENVRAILLRVLIDWEDLIENEGPTNKH